MEVVRDHGIAIEIEELFSSDKSYGKASIVALISDKECLAWLLVVRGYACMLRELKLTLILSEGANRQGLSADPMNNLLPAHWI